MTITIGDAATIGEKEIKTKYPVVKGTTAGTTKVEGSTINLVPEIESLVSKKDKEGL